MAWERKNPFINLSPIVQSFPLSFGLVGEQFQVELNNLIGKVLLLELIIERVGIRGKKRRNWINL
jgi:hypothetical protein